MAGDSATLTQTITSSTSCVPICHRYKVSHSSSSSSSDDDDELLTLFVYSYCFFIFSCILQVVPDFFLQRDATLCAVMPQYVVRLCLSVRPSVRL